MPNGGYLDPNMKAEGVWSNANEGIQFFESVNVESTRDGEKPFNMQLLLFNRGSTNRAEKQASWFGAVKKGLAE